MAEVVYVLCALTSAACATLLLRAFRGSRNRLLLWTGLCFVGLAVNNLVLVVDEMLIDSVDLSTWRVVPAAIGMTILVFGLVSEAE